MGENSEPIFDNFPAAIAFLERSGEVGAFSLSREVTGRILELHGICQELHKIAARGVKGEFGQLKALGGYFRTLLGGATANLSEVVGGLKWMTSGINAAIERNKTVRERYNAIVEQMPDLVREIMIFNRFGEALRKRRFDGMPICVYMYVDEVKCLRFYPDQTSVSLFSYELYPKINATMA